jgi:MerR family transcriptional regulator, light-induced transcriptional regulator
MDIDSTDRKPRHPIGVAAERTGLSPEVLRVWERRYGVVEPVRGEGGQRLYSDADVERLRLLRQATQGGRGIGRVAGLELGELARLVREDEEARAELEVKRTGGGAEEFDLEAAVDRARALDADGLETGLRRVAALAGLPRFLERVVVPFVQRVGDEWHAGRLTVAQEHLATAVVQRVVGGMLGSVGGSDRGPAILVSGPAGERHELGALLAAGVAVSEGWRVVYLGTDLPAVEIAEAALATGVRAVGLSVVFVEDRERTLSEILAVRGALPTSIPLLIGGGATAELGDGLDHPTIRVTRDLESFRATLRGWN